MTATMAREEPSASTSTVSTSAAPREVQEHEAIVTYPSQAASLHQTLMDLTHAGRWEHLHLLDLGPDIGRERVMQKGKGKEDEGIEEAGAAGGAAICGLRPEQRGLEVVWPCNISDSLNNQIFVDIFQAIDRLPAEREGQKLLRNHFLLAVLSPDATVVYYSIARGLVKPVN